MPSPASISLASVTKNCDDLKDIYIPIFCACLPLVVGVIVYYIRRPFERAAKKLQKVDDLIEAIIADANIYFTSSHSQGAMLNVTTKLNKLASIINSELLENPEVAAAWGAFRKMVANDDEIKSRTAAVIKLVIATIRDRADQLKETLGIAP